jgi:predicted permease
MRRARALFLRLAGLFRKGRHERELAAEMESHLQMHIEDNLRAGMSAAEARRQALIKLGGVEQTKELYRDRRGLPLFETLFQDFRFAARMFIKNPGFTAVAVLTLALGVGTNAVVFSVVNALVLRPLPVERPNELAFLENKRYGPGQSFPNYKDLRDRNRTFAGLIGYRFAPMELETTARANRIWGYLATGNYFDVLGVKPALGRFFNQSEDLNPGASPFAVLNYSAWQSLFGADPGIVGKTIRINRSPYTVLGVAPPDFHGTEVFYWPQVWVPMMMEPQIEAGRPWLDNRNTWNTWVIGRLKPNVSRAQAEADLNAVAAELARQYPNENESLAFRLAKPGLVGDFIGGPARASALGVLALAGLVLLAACANLASMLTARAADRQREIAIRLAIGAGRGRVVRQVLTETLMLSLAGGGAGYLLAAFLSQALSRWRAPMDFPLQYDVNPDWRVFLFAVAASFFAAALFGSAPAWRASKADPNAVLKGSSTTWGRSRLALRDILVVVQVALCFVLVSASLLSLRGLQQALNLNLGFESRHVSVAAFELGLAGYSEERGSAFQQRALAAVRLLPGVESAAYSNSVPLSMDQSHTGVFPADKPDLRASDRIGVNFYEVSPGFFATLGTRLLAGREFNSHDDVKSPQVAIVNVAFAKRVLHAESAVGMHFRRGLRGPLAEVVGIVEDGKYESLTESLQPVVFWSILQSYNSTTTLEVRSSRPPTEMVREIRGAISRLDPELPLYGTGSLEQMLGFAFFPTRAAAIALSAFGLLAIMLAATGVYGLMSYAVSRRTNEIGVRMALGAHPVHVLRLVLGKTTLLLAFGSVIGLILALAIGRVVASIVYQAQLHDPVVMMTVLATIALVGLFSSWSPVRRAMRVDPMVALRYE